MLLKSINIIMAYAISAIFIATCLAITYYWPQMIDPQLEVSNQMIIKMILAALVGLVIFSSPIVVIMGIFALIKSIISPFYYMAIGVFAIMVFIAFTPGFQSLKGVEAGFWVPFYGVIFGAIAGSIFWYLAIRTPQAKA